MAKINQVKTFFQDYPEKHLSDAERALGVCVHDHKKRLSLPPFIFPPSPSPFVRLSISRLPAFRAAVPRHLFIPSSLPPSVTVQTACKVRGCKVLSAVRSICSRSQSESYVLISSFSLSRFPFCISPSLLTFSLPNSLRSFFRPPRLMDHRIMVSFNLVIGSVFGQSHLRAFLEKYAG